MDLCYAAFQTRTDFMHYRGFQFCDCILGRVPIKMFLVLPVVLLEGPPLPEAFSAFFIVSRRSRISGLLEILLKISHFLFHCSGSVGCLLALLCLLANLYMTVVLSYCTQ